MGRPIPAEVSDIVPVNADVIDRKISKVTASHADRKQRITDLNSKLDDITLNGVQSAPLRAHYGDAVNFSDNSFKAIHGKTKGAAVAEKHAQVRGNMLAEQYLANRQVKRLTTLKEARKNVTLTPAEKILAHHGIKGMRWGVRKADDDTSSSGGKSGVGHEEDSDDVKKVNAAKAKIAKSGSTNVLSNEDLQRVVSRMNLDQQYSNLTKEKSDLEKGNDNAKKVLDLIGTVQKAHAIYNSPLGKSVKKGVKDARKTVKVYKRARRIAKLARDAVQVAAVVA